MNTSEEPLYNPERVRSVLEQLSALTDQLEMVSYLLRETKHLRHRGPTCWYYTRQYFKIIHQPETASEVTSVFKIVAVEDEIGAVLWLAEHQHLFPDLVPMAAARH